MRRLRLLDLYCGAGGAGMGYHIAGFDVVGVDRRPQPNYPFEFHEADALEYPLEGFDAIHASPPCQKHSILRRGRWKDREHPELVAPTRERLVAAGVPYVIENVIGAPLIRPLMLCGTMFGLGTKEGSQLRRHRLFEAPWFAGLVPPCQHNDGAAIGVYGGGQAPGRRYHRRPATIGVWGKPGGRSTRDDLDHYNLAARKYAMGIDWMTWRELSESIPPAYTQFVGQHLLEYLQELRGAA